jgi:PAS domain S-box-containing protein
MQNTNTEVESHRDQTRHSQAQFDRQLIIIFLFFFFAAVSATAVVSLTDSFVRWYALAAAVITLICSLCTARLLRQIFDRVDLLRSGMIETLKTEKLHAKAEGSDLIARLSDTCFSVAGAYMELHQRERAIADFALDVFWSLSPGGEFTAVSRASRRVWGYDEEQIVGRNYLDFVHKEDRPKAAALLKDARQGPLAKFDEIRIIRFDQSTCDIELTLEWSDSQAAYFCLGSDISARKQIERLKQEYVAMLSHDLRTPLTSLRFSLALLAKQTYGNLDDDGLEAVRSAEDNVSRLITLINQLLDLEKLEAGHIDLNHELFPFNDISESAIRSLNSFAQQHNIQLASEPATVELWGDRGRIDQVVINLLSNAIKFSPSGSTVNIRATEDDRFSEIRVQDSGPGIDSSAQELIFDRFKQLVKTEGENKDERIESSGLGLAICKGLIEAHGGTIGVDSEPGQGSSFWIRLPRYLDSQSGN